jgi:murein DD-endopeptidase MepM/ murein hydrolase activator NlpD
LKREIPQKVDNHLPLANSEVATAVFQNRSTLFRRTRSSAMFGLALTAGTMSTLIVHSKAVAFSPVRSSALATIPSISPDASGDANETAIQPEALDTQTEFSQAPMTGFSAAPALQNLSQVDAIDSGNELSSQALSGARLAVQVQSGQPIPIDLNAVNGESNSAAIGADQDPLNLARAIVLNPGQTPLRESEILIHHVNEGETLTRISEQYKVSPSALIQANHISDPNVIKVDEKLVIPATASSASITPIATFPATPLHGTSLAAQALQNNNFLSQPTSTPASSLDEPSGQAQNSEVPTVITEERSLSATQAETPQSLPTASQSLVSQRVSTMLGMKQDIQPVGLKDSSTSETFGDVKSRASGQKLALFQTQLSPQRSPQLPVLQKGTPMARRSLIPMTIPALELPPLAAVDSFLPSSMGQGNQKYSWPANGMMTSGYGWRWGRMHRGIDIAGPIGTPVIAAAAGVVHFAGWNDGGYGYMVEIKHPDGSLTRYAHNDRIHVRRGETVAQGQRISDMGSTGRSTGPHLHFEIHTAGRGGAVNPMMFLASR